MPSITASMACLAMASLPLFATSQTFRAFDHSDGFSPYGTGFAPDVVPFHPESDSLVQSMENPVRNSSSQASVTSLSGQESRKAGRAARDFYLRVMPLGASITQGQESTDQNGYRKWLRSQLRWKGWNVNMVGSKHDGSMQDDDNEGHPAWTIGSIHGAFTDSKWMMPNLVLVNAGLNDCNNNMEAGAVNRLRNMTDDIFESIPGVTVILSTLLKNRNQDPCTERISQGIRELVDEYGGKRIGLADIRPRLTLNDLVDGSHPSDYGYEVFASVWWDAIRQLEDKLQPPHGVAGLTDGNSSGNKCKKVAGNSGLSVPSQLGSGEDDGNYVHSSTARGVLPTARIDKGSDPKGTTDEYPWHIFFANLVVGDPSASRSAALDDWIRIWHAPNDRNTYYLRQNLGGGQFGASVQFDVDMDCDLGPRYAFADLNNDGLDDFFCLKGSSVWVSLNRGGNPPKFESIGQVIGNLDGYTASDVRIADIDGDGRADFCLIRSDGSIIASRNGGTGDKPTWQGFSVQASVRGVVFSTNKAAKSGIVLADLNGDFKSDYMWISDHGSVETWINNRGVGGGIIPAWRSAGTTHSGQEAIGIQDRIKFGRIFGSGHSDYIYLKEEDDHYDMVVWENKGSGGTTLKADGNFYCDMFDKGSEDFVWIYQDGHAAELNINIRSPPNWNHDIKITLNVPGPRVGIHLADWNGDGKCDVLVQNKATGALTMYQNNYKQGDATITFGSGVIVTPGTCDQGWGVGIFDRGMAVRDLDGDGRADALCIYPDGRITAWLNLKSGLVDVGQIKFSEGWDRANIRFADVEASGRTDLLHVDKYTGAVTVFTNNGRTTTGSSSFSWTNRKKLYNGINRGETMVFTNQGGLYRADMVHVDPKTNKAWTYFNKCGNSGGDDGPISDPGLPAVGGGYVPSGHPTPPNPLPSKSEGGSATLSPIITQPPNLPTDFVDCRHQNEDPGQGINSAYCVCFSSTFAQSIATWVTPQNSCAYTTRPTRTVPGPSGLPKTTDKGACKVCSVVGQNNRECDDLPNCTPTPTPTPKRCITAHNYVYVDQQFGGTKMSVQIWDNGKKVCDDGSSQVFASDTTNWDYDCENGGKAHVTDNGRIVEYTAGDGYFLAIPRTDGKRDKEVCGFFTGPSETQHTLWCTIWEYAFDNGDACDNRCPIIKTCGDRHCDFDGTCED